MLQKDIYIDILEQGDNFIIFENFDGEKLWKFRFTYLFWAFQSCIAGIAVTSKWSKFMLASMYTNLFVTSPKVNAVMYAEKRFPHPVLVFGHWTYLNLWALEGSFASSYCCAYLFLVRWCWKMKMMRMNDITSLDVLLSWHRFLRHSSCHRLFSVFVLELSGLVGHNVLDESSCEGGIHMLVQRWRYRMTSARKLVASSHKDKRSLGIDADVSRIWHRSVGITWHACQLFSGKFLKSLLPVLLLVQICEDIAVFFRFYIFTFPKFGC